jgi:hypothetical protein
MNPRLVDIPVYSSAAAVVAAHHYNRARLALLRLGAPIFLHLKPLKHMAFVIESDAWIVVDEVLNEYPIIAWVDFQTGDRNALHEPIACHLHCYHEHAGRIVETALQTMDSMLSRMLSEARDGG